MTSTHSGHKLTTSPCSDEAHSRCLLCHNNSSLIGPACQAQLDRYALRYDCEITPHLPATALYPYVPLLRDLVLRVKIAGSLRAWQAVVQLLNRKLDFSQPQVIVPAPSSLWSRLRGRHDLAWMMAGHLAQQTNARLIEAPLFTHWRLRKQTQARQRGLYHPPNWPPKLLQLMLPQVVGQKILLVDDVITSGATLRQLAALFPDNEVSAFALCLSPGHGFVRRRRA